MGRGVDGEGMQRGTALSGADWCRLVPSSGSLRWGVEAVAVAAGGGGSRVAGAIGVALWGGVLGGDGCWVG